MSLAIPMQNRFVVYTASEAKQVKRIAHQIGLYLLSLVTIQIDKVTHEFCF